MGFTKNLTELSERIGEGTYDFADILAEKTRIFACEFWQKFPDRVVSGDSLDGSFTRGFMNRMCRNETLPNPPQVPYTGGQCNVSYYITSTARVSIDNSFRNVKQGDLIVISGINFPHLGPIEGLELNPFVNNEIAQIKALNNPNNIFMSYVKDGAQIRWRQPQSGGLAISDIFVDEIFGHVLTRVDGQPDDCGNVPSDYPTTNPNPSDYHTTIIINMDDGDDLTIPLTYNPINVSFPMNFDLGGIHLRIDLGGIHFNFSLVSIDGIPLPLPDGNLSPLPIPNDDENRKFPTPKLPPPSSPRFEPIERDENDPKEEDIGENIEFVKIEILSKPGNYKHQWGDGAPDVIYSGWFEFQSEGYNFPRQPIHFDKTIFRKPEGATGYAYTVYEGYSAKATVYIFNDEDE